jgi:hypothetical protein
VNARHFGSGGKVIVFVGRHLTAIYLVEALRQIFGDRLRIGCTVEAGEINPRLKTSPYRSEVLRQFSPRSHHLYDLELEYDVLICTDADGVGVNLQDADSVVNYDAPDGADVLFQRAGRVLRMTTEAKRIVHFYTLVPSLLDEPPGNSRVRAGLQEIFQRIVQRHDKSRRILGSSVMATADQVELRLDGDVSVELLTRDQALFEEIGGLDAQAMISHTATFETHRAQAETLPAHLLSARQYAGRERRVFVLLEQQGRYQPLIYNLSTGQLESAEVLAALDLVRCRPDTPRALIKPGDIEHAANQAVQLWCATEGVPVDSVRKICGLYLLPADASEQLATLFDLPEA